MDTLHRHGGRRDRDRGSANAPTTTSSAVGKAPTQKPRKQHRPKTLLLLLKSLVGLRVRIDLKNDSVIEGVVQEVVHDMEYVRGSLPPICFFSPLLRLVHTCMFVPNGRISIGFSAPGNQCALALRRYTDTNKCTTLCNGMLCPALR